MKETDFDSDLKIYLNQIDKISLLTPKEERESFIDLDQAREEQEREKQEREENVDDEIQRLKKKIIEANLRLVVKIAIRIAGSPEAYFLPDLIQAGNIGLMRAVDKFDWHRGIKFSTYATWWIRHGVIREIQDHGYTIRIPTHVRAELNILVKTSARLEQGDRDGDLTIEELEQETDLGSDRIERALRAKVLDEILSLNYVLSQKGGRTKEFGDSLTDTESPLPDEEIEVEDLKEKIYEVMAGFSDREIEIIKLRFGFSHIEPWTLERIGGRFDISRERVRQIEEKVLIKLRHPVRVQKLRDFLEE